MRIAAIQRWVALTFVCLIVLFAQEVPDSTRRVFSQAIIPTAQPRDASPPPPILEFPLPPSPAIEELLPGLQLIDPDRDIAETAWQYFEKNYEPATGWFDSVRGYRSTTMWDLSSGLAAVACAEQLKIISAQRADQLLRSALLSLAKIRLYNSELPNREYSTATATISGPKAVAGKGTGWSALDLGRLLIWLKILVTWHPEYDGITRDIVQRWKFDRLAQASEMFGIYYGGASEYHRQEGRLGYEQYSASGYELWGISMKRARGYGEAQPVEVLGVQLAADKRNLPYLTSDPFLLTAFELGPIDQTYETLTRSLYRVQEIRWETTHEITAASEDALDRSPWFVYFSIYYQGQPWQCRDHSGAPSPANCGFSTKAALGWAALFDDKYSQLLEKTARTLASPDGYFAGEYRDGQRNASLNINTNAVILEAMLYRQRGRRAFLETKL